MRLDVAALVAVLSRGSGDFLVWKAVRQFLTHFPNLYDMSEMD
jgi:hypothetical protein